MEAIFSAAVVMTGGKASKAHTYYSLFINKSFTLNEMFQRNASKFAIFFV